MFFIVSHSYFEVKNKMLKVGVEYIQPVQSKRE
jgi:hypothetical protein